MSRRGEGNLRGPTKESDKKRSSVIKIHDHRFVLSSEQKIKMSSATKIEDRSFISTIENKKVFFSCHKSRLLFCFI